MTTLPEQTVFGGFPAIGKATAIPNIFFATVLPRLSAPGALLAFLWASRLIQEQRGDLRCVTAEDIWAQPGAGASFEAMAAGRAGLDSGLAECVAVHALLGLELRGPAGVENVYFLNNPASRRIVVRVRAGELRLRADSIATPLVEPEDRPGIFRLYEEHIGTITPMVGDRLVEAESSYPLDWIQDAFREAAELNIRNWRYIERILIRWAEEGRAYETPGRDPLEEQKRRFLGGNLGHIVRYR
jgi:DNA replication protein